MSAGEDAETYSEDKRRLQEFECRSNLAYSAFQWHTEHKYLPHETFSRRRRC